MQRFVFQKLLHELEEAGLCTCLPDTVTPGAVAGYLAVFSLCNQTVNQNVVTCHVPNGARA